MVMRPKSAFDVSSVCFHTTAANHRTARNFSNTPGRTIGFDHATTGSDPGLLQNGNQGEFLPVGWPILLMGLGLEGL